LADNANYKNAAASHTFLSSYLRIVSRK